MTDTDREYIAGGDDVDSHKRYQAVSRVRNRINEELSTDVKLLREHHPGLHEELRDVVCEDGEEPQEPRSSRVFDEDEVDGMREAIEEADQQDQEEAREVAGRFEESVSADFDLPAETEISDDVWGVVNEASASWDDEPERLETRRKAAATALQYALDHNVHLGKSSDVVEAIREKYPVEGQKAETWWRKNVRDDVLKAVGTYSKGHHGYAVTDLERNDE